MSLSYSETLDAVAQSHARVVSALSNLTDDEARSPSLLPGWSRGHVATHISRNADALHRFVVGVLTGVPGEMYPGGPDARAAAIEEGADRPAALLAADYAFAGSRVVRELGEITEDLFDTPIAWRMPIVARDLPVLRWRELEIHHVDLGLGYTPDDWPADFVASTLESQLPRLAAAAPYVSVPDLPDAQVLAWLIGRPQSPGLPELPAWPF
ncbi:maleylpyruvate isomerase family mycothiol-dependent enzyme [Aldersonia sp. NBC_00410]|uniref:maleylpyruvate isomerase family mycothiol-dependent enzyme n=1 Tax=Aldersonia sp. NBC_00410 TaxID=2975954 RepID=UPI002255B49E|nr:maleylpyruvate isomerase family mycothiol-dependent enzyme [Aldersonia sp. NBC_00410]MCX5043413.1 maleylpyruvate isomerase family mycothiol-dependent enzyme [Aldersonia sp. NBC_00410]